LIVWIVTELLVNGVLWKVFQLSVAGQHLIYFASTCIRLDCEKNPLLFLFGVQKLFCIYSTSHCLDTSLSPLHSALLRERLGLSAEKYVEYLPCQSNVHLKVHFITSQQIWAFLPLHSTAQNMSTWQIFSAVS